jgi:hypothetical protein
LLAHLHFFLDKGISAYGHDLLVNVEENAMNELLEIYKENIFVVENSSCKYSQSEFKFSAFNKDTNIWKLNIVDTITGEQVHSDFWQLVKTK